MILFVRHGETDCNRQGIIQGQLDAPLNEEGIKQAEETAEKHVCRLAFVQKSGTITSAVLANANQIVCDIITNVAPAAAVCCRDNSPVRPPGVSLRYSPGMVRS